jgi:hypothetical protein
MELYLQGQWGAKSLRINASAKFRFGRNMLDFYIGSLHICKGPQVLSSPFQLERSAKYQRETCYYTFSKDDYYLEFLQRKGPKIGNEFKWTRYSLRTSHNTEIWNKIKDSSIE